MSTTIHAMSIFVRAVETNSFMGAARSLFIDPGAVSRTIKALEGELGVLLFARSTRSLKLTPEGARFYRDCVQILQRFEAATKRFRSDEAAQQGRLKVGLAPACRDGCCFAKFRHSHNNILGSKSSWSASKTWRKSAKRASMWCFAEPAGASTAQRTPTRRASSSTNSFNRR